MITANEAVGLVFTVEDDGRIVGLVVVVVKEIRLQSSLKLPRRVVRGRKRIVRRLMVGGLIFKVLRWLVIRFRLVGVDKAVPEEEVLVGKRKSGEPVEGSLLGVVLVQAMLAHDT